ncbi:MAG: WcaF family extracellular polysaccharide biosynthesis acetyltransferase [Cyclobacteriaceae bacterium]
MTNFVGMSASSDLSTFNNAWYKPGKPLFIRLLWYYTNALFFKSSWMLIPGIKPYLLRLFGARVGKGVIIKPNVNIKYPWKLSIGNYVWIGENAWIDNLDEVSIGNHVCISQGAMLLCGSHNYKKTSFDLMTAGIVLQDGVWIGAHAVVCPGVTCASHSILSVSSVANSNLLPHTIYQGNPAQPKRKRIIQPSS